jgi:hypothetical protein
MHLVKDNPFCPNVPPHPIRREEKFGQTSKLDIYEPKSKLSKRTNREISLANLPKNCRISPKMSQLLHGLVET